jgi:aspartate racemase
MQRGIQRLEAAGARCVAIPCHTAHFWYDQLVETATVPILHIVDAVLADLTRTDTRRIGLLATAATLKAGFYQERLAAAGYTSIEPTAEIMTTAVLPTIAMVKRDRTADAAPLLMRAIEHLTGAGADRILLACTELPLALAAAPEAPRCLDATLALGRACIAWHRDHAQA